MVTNLYVMRHLAIVYDNCGGDLWHVISWIIDILSAFRSLPVSYKLNDWPSHLCAVYIFSARCVGLGKFKGKGFSIKLWGIG